MPSKQESSGHVGYVSALCTHHPLLLLIEWSGDVFVSRRWMQFMPRRREKAIEPYHLEEGLEIYL
jgi:hypothetical protein